jgi:hypothetical protein
MSDSMSAPARTAPFAGLARCGHCCVQNVELVVGKLNGGKRMNVGHCKLGVCWTASPRQRLDYVQVFRHT